jgi:hypothetical protein
MAKYLYGYHEERGFADLYVTDVNGNTVWEVHYPSFYESNGEMLEETTIFEDGFMKGADDIEGLENYLKSISVINRGDELVDRDEDMDDDYDYEHDDYEYAAGGTIEAKIKKRLKNAFELPIQIAVYVPSTRDKDIIITKREMEARVEDVQRFLANAFGGFSAVKVEGGFESSDKGLIQEDAVRVVAFASKENENGVPFEQSFESLMNQVKNWCSKWSQQSIGVEFENDLFYVDTETKFSGGGFTQYGEPMGFEEESDSVYEIHHKPNYNSKNPYLIWDKIDGVYIAEFPNRQRALHFIDYKSIGYMSDGGEVEDEVYNAYVVWIDDNDEAFFDGGWWSIEDAEDRVSDIEWEEDNKPKYKVFAVEYDEDYFENKNWDITRMKSYKPYPLTRMARGGKTYEYETYHNTLASALNEADKYVERKGLKFTDETYFPDVTMGGISYGQTARLTRGIQREGKKKEDVLIVVIYRMDSGKYELTMYTSYKKGGTTDDVQLNDIVWFREEKGNFIVEKNTVYAWLYDDPKASDKLESGEYDYVLFPMGGGIGLQMQKGYVPPLQRIWTKKYQNKTKGSDRLIGIVQAWYDEENKKLYIDMMTTRKDMRRKGVNSHIIRELRKELGLEREQVEFVNTTQDGEKFSKSSKYADGGEVPSKKEMLDYLKMYFKYYSELRTIAVEEDGILTKRMLPTLDNEQIEMAYEDAKYELDEILKYENYEDGGDIAEGNLEMLRSNAKAIKHHAEELEGELNDDTEVEAWVVAKGERAETDLSDITHYLDGKEFSLGGMTAGRYYRDNSGEEFKFIGKVDSGANKGRFLFSDGKKSVYKDLSDFEGGKPKETKLFGFFEDGGEMEFGGMLIHGFQEGDIILEIYKGYGIIENNNNGVIEVLNPNRGTRFIIDLDESKPTGRKSMGMSREKQIESAKAYIDYLDNPLPDTLLEKFRAEGKMEKGGYMAKGGSIKSLEKRVAEVNELIKRGNELGIEVVDEGNTWQAPMKYKPLKYTNGVLYISYEQLDLYKYSKTYSSHWEKKSYKIGKYESGYGYQGEAGAAQREALTDIARMYRKPLKSYDTYGYFEDGGEVNKVNPEEIKVKIEQILDKVVPSFYKGVSIHKNIFDTGNNIRIFIAASDYKINGVSGQLPQVVSLSLDLSDMDLHPQVYGGNGGQRIDREKDMNDPNEKFFAFSTIKIPFRTPQPNEKAVLDAIRRFAENYKKTLAENREVLLYQDIVDYDKLLADSQYADGGMMAKGGDLRKKSYAIIYFQNDKKVKKSGYQSAYEAFSDYETEGSIKAELYKDNMLVSSYPNKADGGMMAEGGETKKYTDKLIEYLKKWGQLNEGRESIAKDGTKYRYDRYSTRGESANNWIVALFENAAQENGNRYATQFSYKDIYSISYDRPKYKGVVNGKITITELVEGDKMAKGGVIASSETKEGIEKLISDYYYSSKISLKKVDNKDEYEVINSKGKINGVKVVLKRGRYQFINSDKMAMGGTFAEGVKAIEKRLVGTKVNPKYQKDYGKTYDKAEAHEAASKIKGKMRAMELAKKYKKKK